MENGKDKQWEYIMPFSRFYLEINNGISELKNQFDVLEAVL
jgi:hypothetical protein